jgi:hypothetical protein
MEKRRKIESLFWQVVVSILIAVIATVISGPVGGLVVALTASALIGYIWKDELLTFSSKAGEFTPINDFFDWILRR